MPPDNKETNGSKYYKTDGVEPIDLYRDGGMLQDFALANIIKYAFRNRRGADRLSNKTVQDMNKVIHYAEIIKKMLE